MIALLSSSPSWRRVHNEPSTIPSSNCHSHRSVYVRSSSASLKHARVLSIGVWSLLLVKARYKTGQQRSEGKLTLKCSVTLLLATGVWAISDTNVTLSSQLIVTKNVNNNNNNNICVDSLMHWDKYVHYTLHVNTSAKDVTLTRKVTDTHVLNSFHDLNGMYSWRHTRTAWACSNV